MAVSTLIRAKAHRREDPRLVRGQGHYAEDFVLPHTAYLAVVRSPHAHARVTSIDTSAAKAAHGVVAVYVAKDFEKVISGGIPVAPFFVAEKKTVPDRFPVASGEVCFQGEAVAVVVADTNYEAADAAQLVKVDYEPVPAEMDMEKALEHGSPKAHEGLPDNLGWDLTFSADADAAFAEADVVVKERILQQRLAPTPIEARTVLAEWNEGDRTLTMWTPSQDPHIIRLFLAGALGIPETRFRVISPDVGGGFGCKANPYPEDYLVPAASKLLGRPVKWIETRTENLHQGTHGRAQFF